jgi:hypothetical protein
MSVSQAREKGPTRLRRRPENFMDNNETCQKYRNLRRRVQLDLFGAPTSAASLSTVLVSRRCRCGGTTARLGSSCAMHAGRLTCSDCGLFLGWASHALVTDTRR